MHYPCDIEFCLTYHSSCLEVHKTASQRNFVLSCQSMQNVILVFDDKIIPAMKNASQW